VVNCLTLLLLLLLLVTSSTAATTITTTVYFQFLDLGSQNATLAVVLIVGISSLKVPGAFLIPVHSGAQRNFAYTSMLTLPTDLPSRIFHFFLINE